MGLSYNLEKLDPTTLQIRFEGMLNENAVLPTKEQIESATPRKIIMDLNKVEFINSSGIKSWVNFIGWLERMDGLTISFVNTPRIFIDQINMIEGFLPSNATIESTLVPLFCEKCEESVYVHMDCTKFNDIPSEDEILDLFQPDQCDNYPQCRKKQEVDVLPEHYFSFLKRK